MKNHYIFVENRKNYSIGAKWYKILRDKYYEFITKCDTSVMMETLYYI